MDASHILVGALTAIAFSWLVWVEIRSRRNTAAQPEQQSVPLPLAEAQPPPKTRKRGRR